jgi:hypothetical protein
VQIFKFGPKDSKQWFELDFSLCVLIKIIGMPGRASEIVYQLHSSSGTKQQIFFFATPTNNGKFEETSFKKFQSKLHMKVQVRKPLQTAEKNLNLGTSKKHQKLFKKSFCKIYLTWWFFF